MNKLIDKKCTCGKAMRLVRWPTLANGSASYKVECYGNCGMAVEGLHDWEETKAKWNKAVAA